jgi:hypothetical protein
MTGTRAENGVKSTLLTCGDALPQGKGHLRELRAKTDDTAFQTGLRGDG